jgi:putative ABC transport system permease protein
MLGLGVASLLGGLFGGGGSALALVGLGVLLVFFGVSVLGRTVALPLSRAIGALLPRLRGITGNLARENAMRNPKRTAATASALMIGVALIGFISILAASTRTSINASIDKAFTSDFVVNPGTFGIGGLDPGLQGSPDDLGRDAIAVFEEVADEDGLAIGDTVQVNFKDTGVQPLRVVMIYGEDEPAGDYLIGRAAYEANFAEQFDTFVFVRKAADVEAGQALAAVQRVADDFPGAEVQDRTGFKEDLTEPVNQILGLVYALLALAVVIALLGIGNTLALSILERTREVGLLRSVGMTRSQLRSTIRWESVIIALQGTLLGILIGIFFGWALVRALRDEGIDQFTVPFGTLLIVIVLAALAGVVAAVLPARRAAKLDVLRAIVAE